MFIIFHTKNKKLAHILLLICNVTMLIGKWKHIPVGRYIDGPIVAIVYSQETIDGNVWFMEIQ